MTQNNEPLGFQYSIRDLLLSLVALGFAMAVLALVPHSHRKPGIRPGELIIEMQWAKNSNSDIDLWVRAPGHRPVGWSRKSGKVCDLLRDDLGRAVDKFNNNTEWTVCRAAVPGEYVVDAMAYNVYDGQFPVAVRVTVSELKASTHVLLQRTFELTHNGQQVTAFEFTLDKHGNVIRVNDVQVKLYAQESY